MNRIRVRVQKNRFRRFARVMPEWAEELVSRTAEAIESKARDKAPVGETGHLKDSFGSRSARSRSNSPRWIVWNSAFYSGFVEYGTKHAKARKFLKPTARAEIRQFRKEAGEIEKALKERGD